MEWKIFRILEGDFGCEERAEDSPLMCIVILKNGNGETRELSVSDDFLRSNNLCEGDNWVD